MIVISVLYITSFYPSEEEPFRGHYIEKQATLLGKALGEKVIVFKLEFSGRVNKAEIVFNQFRGVNIYTIIFPNILRYLSIYLTTKIAFSFFNKEIKAILNTDRPSLIVSNDIWASLKWGNELQRKTKCKHILIVHGESPNVKKLSYLKRMIRKELKKCSTVFTVSTKTKNYIMREFNLDDQIIVNANGLNEDLIQKYSKFNFQKQNVLTITSIGNLNFNKGFDLVIKALKEVDIPFEYNIIGDGYYKNNLLRLIEENNLKEKVHFIGNIKNEEVLEYLEKSHYFILPSRNEAFGIVYLEAMITKNICIGTKGEGCEDFIDNGSNGYLVTNENEIRKLILNYSKIKESSLIENGFITAKKYTWRRNVDILKRAYLE